MRSGRAIAAMLTVAMPAAAQAMTVETFLAKTKALMAQGLLAATSSDLPLVRGEVTAASDAYRAEIAAAAASGKRMRGCPPPKGQTNIDGKVLVTEFEKIPPGKRSMSVKDAFYAMMDRRYPCR